jgi:hypothetical protein
MSRIAPSARIEEQIHALLGERIGDPDRLAGGRPTGNPTHPPARTGG